MVDFQTVAVAALPGFLFGGINVYALIRFSYNLGNYRGSQDAKDTRLNSDLGELKTNLGSLGTQLATYASAQAQIVQKHELQLQANTISLEYLRGRDRVLGERTHAVANLEQVVRGLDADVKELRQQLSEHRG